MRTSTHFHRTTSLALLTLAGCKGCQDAPTVPGDLEAASPTAVDLQIVDGLGVGTTDVLVVGLNELGAIVPVEGVNTLVAGVVTERTTETSGWASVAVSGSGAVAVEASMGGATASGHAWLVAQDLPAWASVGSPAADAPEAVTVAGGGVAWTRGSEVWWAAPGGRPVRVASLPSTVSGIDAVRLDGDGVVDLLAWSTTAVVALRGRDAGGLVYGGGWLPADGGVIVAAAVGQLVGDAAADIAIALQGEESTHIVLLESDGVWNFTDAEAFDLPVQGRSMTFQDLDADGEAELTFLDTDGSLRRFGRYDGGWTTVNVSTLFELGLGRGARLYATVDLTNDGIGDIVAAGPLADGSGYQTWVVTVGAASPSQFRLYSGSADRPIPESLDIAVGDVSGDGLPEVLLSAPAALTRAYWSDETGGFRLADLPALPPGPLALADFDDDLLLDLVVAAPHPVVARGTRTDDDPATPTDESLPWSLAAPTTDVFDLAWTGALDLGADRTADGRVDAVGFTQGASGLALAMWAGAAGTADFRTPVAAVVSATAAPLDLAVCGTDAWTLVAESNGTRTARRYALRAAGLTASSPVFDAGAAEHIVCGTFTDGLAALVTADGTVTLITPTGTTLAGTALTGPVEDVAVRTDASGVSVLAGCGAAECHVVALDLDGDGSDEVVTTDESGTSIAWSDGTTEALDAVGVPTVGDADGDGTPDLLVTDAGTVVIHRALGGPAPAEVRAAWVATVGGVWVGDLDGDAVPDLFLPGDPTDPAAEGRVYYVAGAGTR